MDIVQVANLNVKVLKELRKSTTEFEKFNQYLNMMNTFVGQTAHLTDAVNYQLHRTDEIKQVIEGMQQNVDNNRQVMGMLQMFLQKVDARSALLEASAALDDTMADAIGHLKKHIQDEINAIQVHTADATSKLDELMQKERGQLDRLKNLDKLGELDQLKQLSKLISSMDSMKSTFENQNSQLAAQIGNLSRSVAKFKNNQASATLGVPAGVIWVVSIVIAIAALIFIGTQAYSAYKNFKSDLPEGMAFVPTSNTNQNAEMQNRTYDFPSLENDSHVKKA